MPKVAILRDGGGGDWKLDYVTTLEQARATFDPIIVGRPTKGFLGNTHWVTYLPHDPGDNDPTNYIDMEWTEGPFVVERVLFQKAGSGLAAGATIQVVQLVGLAVEVKNAVRCVSEDCYDLKQSSRYVLLLNRGRNGKRFVMDNFNLGRFNTDGTDCEDEADVTNGLNDDGSKTDKQKLRDELTAQYNITFAPMRPARGISAFVLGRPRGDGTTAIIYVTVTPPQPGNSMLEIQQSSAAAGP